MTEQLQPQQALDEQERDAAVAPSDLAPTGAEDIIAPSPNALRRPGRWEASSGDFATSSGKTLEHLTLS